VTPADVEDHHVFRPGILQVFGWRVLNVSALDWAQDEDAVLARIEACLERDIAEDIDDNPLEGQRSAAAPSPAAAPAPGPVSAAISDVAFTSYHFRDGSSDKFWRIGVHATEVTVQFGRVGTTGQTVVKNYESAERARREADKLVLEKTRKGYTETDMTA
jgi:predicted DNA-binding WGR domain protein